MELHVVLRRLADRRLALVQPAELRADVGGAGAIAILWEPTLFVLANAQPPNPTDGGARSHSVPYVTFFVP